MVVLCNWHCDLLHPEDASHLDHLQQGEVNLAAAQRAFDYTFDRLLARIVV